MKRILVIADPIHSGQYAFEKALSLAKRTVASIHIVVFCHESFGSIEEDRWAELQKMVMERYKQWWENYLANHIIESQISYEIIWQKHIHQWLLEHCRKTHYDLIVKTGKRSENFFHTPTDWQLFRQSKTPVYSINRDQQGSSPVILVALDLMTRHKQKQQLNRRLLEAGFQLALQTNASLHCCYVMEMSPWLKELYPASTTELNQRQAKAAAAEFMDIYDLDEQQLHIQGGTASKVINDLAHDLNAGCIIIGSMGRSGISEKLMGNTAEQVIHYAKSDLLVISPD